MKGLHMSILLLTDLNQSNQPDKTMSDLKLKRGIWLWNGGHRANIMVLLQMELKL